MGGHPLGQSEGGRCLNRGKDPVGGPTAPHLVAVPVCKMDHTLKLKRSKVIIGRLPVLRHARPALQMRSCSQSAVLKSRRTRLPCKRWQSAFRVDHAITPAWSATLSATWKAAENDCLERRNSIRPCVPSHAAYKAERGGNELFWSPWTMYPRSQERRRNREATVYLPALGGDGPRLDRTIRIYKCSQASSAEESLKCCAALLAVSTEA